MYYQLTANNPCEEYNGIVDGKGVCCSSTCNKCGGKGCAKETGCAGGKGCANKCCTQRITKKGKICGT